MNDVCPICETKLVPLYEARNQSPVTSYHEFIQYYIYGYWCPLDRKMFKEKTKSWLEEVQSLQGSTKDG